MAARLLHLFQRQAKTLTQRRENARLEAKEAEIERRQAAELKRRRELEERIWDPEFEEDDIEDDEDAGDWAAEAADRDPAARDAPAPADTAEICERIGALFARNAAEKRAQAQAAAGRDGAAGDAAEDGGRGEDADGTGPPE